VTDGDDGELTHVLDALNRGEPLAAEQLLPLVYDELRRLARQRMARESADHTLQPTALVHEAYLRLLGDQDKRGWQNRGHFYAAAAEAMRRILIEAARRKASLKRGGNRVRVDLPNDLAEQELSSSDSLLALDEALKKLELADPDAFKLVMLRYFGGLTVEEAAAVVGVSPRTAKRNWAFARAWLQREIESP
jgi:RNA polymerase sigma factor (TIGR02999 family)